MDSYVNRSCKVLRNISNKWHGTLPPHNNNQVKCFTREKILSVNKKVKEGEKASIKNTNMSVGRIHALAFYYMQVICVGSTRILHVAIKCTYTYRYTYTFFILAVNKIKRQRLKEYSGGNKACMTCHVKIIIIIVITIWLAAKACIFLWWPRLNYAVMHDDDDDLTMYKHIHLRKSAYSFFVKVSGR